MAKAPAAPITPGILPIPDVVVRHHGQSLFGPMREWLTRKNPPPVLLLVGPSGVGKRSVTYLLAQWLLCERSGWSAAAEGELFGGHVASVPPEGDPLPCGECNHCQRAIHGTWVDFTEILPESSEDSNASSALKVDQFRKLKSSLGFGAHDSAFKIIAIPGADRMTAQAANSMLKILEEPPRGWVFLLTASDPTLVLPTVLSRCQTLRLKPFMAPGLRDLLAQAGVPEDRQAICSELSQGSWNKALELARDDIWEKRKELFKFLEDPARTLNAWVDWTTQEPKHFDLFVDQLEQITSELIRWSVSSETMDAARYAWMNSDGKSSLSMHAKRVVQLCGSVAGAREFWLARSKRLAEARSQALAPLNRKLLVQELLLPWLKPNA